MAPKRHASLEEKFYECLIRKYKSLKTTSSDSILVFDTSTVVLLDKHLGPKCVDFLEMLYAENPNIFVPDCVINELSHHNKRGKRYTGIQKVRDDTLLYVVGITGNSRHKELRSKVNENYEAICKLHFQLCLLLPTIAKEYELLNKTRHNKTVIGEITDMSSLRNDIEIVYSAYVLKFSYPDKQVLLVTGDQHLLCTVHHLNDGGEFKIEHNDSYIDLVVERIDVRTLDPNRPCHQNKCYFRFEE